ncbi:MAG: hypothetical protein JWM56_1084 [Candidatus Peribacteria bacterium]|nr:hypothetical protein [Candidatus Peribacteria bacterium]
MHNLEQLFEKVKTEVLVKEWVVIPNKISAADIRHAKSTYLNHLSQQINWLHNNLILQEKLGMPLIPDLMNELFRYPVMKNGASYDFDLLLSKLNRTDIKRIRKRIDIMLRRFNDLGYIIAVELRHSPQITLKPFRPG